MGDIIEFEAARKARRVAAGRSAAVAPLCRGTVGLLPLPAHLPFALWQSAAAVWGSLWLAPFGLCVTLAGHGEKGDAARAARR